MSTELPAGLVRKHKGIYTWEDKYGAKANLVLDKSTLHVSVFGKGNVVSLPKEIISFILSEDPVP